MSLTSLISTTNLIVIIQLLIITYVARFYYKYFTRQSPLPGPFPLPLVGNLFQFGLNPAKYAMDHQHDYDSMFEIWIGSNRFIFLSHRSLIEKVYASNVDNNHFFARPQIPYLEKLGLQHGLIFNNNYPIWKRNRKFVAHSLMSPRFLRQFTLLAQSLFNENESYWDKKEYHIDFAKWIKHFTTDITLRTTTRRPSYCLNAYLFGEDHDPIKSEETKKSVKFSQAVQTFLKGLIFERFVPNVFKHYFPGFYNLNKMYAKNIDWLNETISDIVMKRRMEIENNDEVGSDLIDVLLTINTPRDPNGYDDSETPMSDPEVRATILEVSIAGIDTTGNTFCFVVWQLAHHPNVVARFREEIKEILGDDTTRQIIFEDLEKFAYLDAIIKESQRVIPLVPFTTRKSIVDVDIGGKSWGSNTSFFIHHEQIHRSSDCWKDPDQFIPERFLKGSDHEITKYSFIPFGGGIRICPGRNMAIVELKTLLILLYRKYDIELVDKVSKKPKTVFVGSNICTDLKVIARPRNYNNI
ncbi:11982_t:CDS:2 [Funneliformis caledonium]|uniref:11982_t:CDS:1 n=1 Tax=Funneliformis caledonium TaxID=1117310 RepID=A0A9N9N483_9GLOM|nr:11982_t:CDS:2 [Funneliformis caledonium]